MCGRADNLVQPDLYTDCRNYQMGIFKKKDLIKDKLITITDTLITDEEKQKLIDFASSNPNISVTEVESAEWIWVEGYKGTDKDMKCHNDFQFTLGEEYTIDGEIIMCENGFHFSPTLEQTFKFYPPKDENRFFKVKALINKNQLVKIEKNPMLYSWMNSYTTASKEYEIVPMQLTDNKLVAKSIILLEEISTDEIIKLFYGENSRYYNESDEYKADLRKGGKEYAEQQRYKRIIQKSIIYSYELRRFAQNCNNIATLRKIAILGAEDMNNETRMQMIFDDKYKI